MLPSHRFKLGVNFNLESGRICIPESRIFFDRCWSPSHHFKKGSFGLFIRSHCNPTNYFHFLLIPFPSFQIEKGALDVFDRGLCGQHFFSTTFAPVPRPGRNCFAFQQYLVARILFDHPSTRPDAVLDQHLSAKKRCRSRSLHLRTTTALLKTIRRGKTRYSIGGGEKELQDTGPRRNTDVLFLKAPITLGPP